MTDNEDDKKNELVKDLMEKGNRLPILNDEKSVNNITSNTRTSVEAAFRENRADEITCASNLNKPVQKVPENVGTAMLTIGRRFVDKVKKVTEVALAVAKVVNEGGTTITLGGTLFAKDMVKKITSKVAKETLKNFSLNY